MTMGNAFPFDLIVHLTLLSEGPPDIPALGRATDEMLRMMCQKTGGQPQYAKTGDIHVDTNLDRVTAELLAGEIRLVNSGYLNSIDCIGPMEPRHFEPASSKDRDRNEAAMRELYWGQPIDPAEQREAVEKWLKRWRNTKLRWEYEKQAWNLCMMCMCNVLSGRLGNG